MKETPASPFSASSNLNDGPADEQAGDEASSLNVSERNATDSDGLSEEEFLERKIRAADSSKERVYETARWIHKYRNIEVGEDGLIYAYDDEAGIWRCGDEGGNQKLLELVYDTLDHHFTRGTRRSVTEQMKAQGRRHPDEYGSPVHTVAVDNGLLHLDTGELVDLKPAHRARWQVPVNYDPNAECPAFKNALDQWIPDNRIQKTLQEYVGYALDDTSSRFEKMLLLLGPTDTGKTVFLEVVEHLFGEDNTASQSIQFLANERWGIHNIVGKPVNIRHDLDTSVIKRTGMVKELASGNPMKAEAKHGDPYKARPTAKHFFSANQVPQRKSPDDAFYNRWLTIIFNEQIPRDKQNPNLIDKLTTSDELSGILNWAVTGYQRLHEQEGFTAPRSPEETRELWRSNGDSIDQFIVDLIVNDPESEVETAKVYDEYETYARAQGFAVESKRQVTRRLTRLDGVTKTQVRRDGRKPRVFRGIELIGSRDNIEK